MTSSAPRARMHGVDGVRVRSLTSSGTGGRMFVLVHGIGMSHRYLARLHTELAAHGTVVSVDLPGFGGVPRPKHDLDISQMADALGAVLDDLTARGVVLVGQSMGTQWVVELAVRRPELVQSVVLIGPVADERRRTVLRQSALLTLDTIRETPGANALVFSDYLRCGPAWYLRQLRHMLGYAIEKRLLLLRAPVLIVRGSRDPIAQRTWCRRLRTAAAGPARVIEIPGRAHNAQHTSPRAVASCILSFLAEPPEGGTR